MTWDGDCDSQGRKAGAPRVGHAVVSRTKVAESVTTATPSWLRFQDQVMVLPSAEMLRRPCPNEPSLQSKAPCFTSPCEIGHLLCVQCRRSGACHEASRREKCSV